MKQTYFCPLDQFGSLSLTGPDSQKFLQGQITCDVSKVTQSEGQAGAYCTPKGNVIANFYLVAHEDTLLMHLPANMVETVHKAMSKYIVFSKAELANTSDSWCRIAVWGDEAKACITNAFGEASQSQDHLVWCNDTDSAEFIVYCSPSSKAQVLAKLEQQASLMDVSTWEARQINHGLVYVTPETSDSYVPQMLNLQATGAIDFKKGCYTGQEVVARMQYLGKLKRHLLIGQVTTSETLEVGQQIDAPKRKNVGRITSVAATGNHTYDFTAVINRTEAQQEQLHLHEQDDAVIALTPLPYEIDPQVFERIKL